MAHEVSVTLSDEEYAELAKDAASSGKPIESVVHELLKHQLRSRSTTDQSETDHAFMVRQLREGKLLNVPTREALTAREVASREERARLMSSDKLASDMVIEDRGPR